MYHKVISNNFSLLQLIHGFEDAPRKLIDHLSESYDNQAAKSFFLAGWCGEGVGASAVLKATAKLLKSRRSDPDRRKHFGKIIHVDCSLWKSRRSLQRAIVEELNLGHLLPMFDKEDEDDDFRGIKIGSRLEIPRIGSEINASLRNERFLMIFHYGGEEVIDLAECGIPNPEFGTYALGQLLWSGYGRLQLSERKDKLKLSSAYFKVIRLSHVGNLNVDGILLHSLREEAAEVIGFTGLDDINPTIVLDCFSYSLFLTEQLRGMPRSIYDIDAQAELKKRFQNLKIRKPILGKPFSLDFAWDTHVCNYWICDGVLQGDRAYEVGSALYEVILRMLCYPSNRTQLLTRCFDQQRFNRWILISSNQLGAQDISTIPVITSSCFLTSGGDSQLQLPNDLFVLASNLHVLKLCKCSFDFVSPPFRSCHNLRFLYLHHCTNTREDQGGGPCFPDLLVLDIRFTEFVLLSKMIDLMTNLREVNTKGVSWRYVSQAWEKLQNIHKLRVTESSDVIMMDTCSSVDMMNMELLDLSGNVHLASLPEMTTARYLKMLVLDGCSSLQQVVFGGAPPLLESFSFDGYGPAEKWIHPIQLPEKELCPKSRNVPEAKVRRISLEGCARLCNVFLHALPNLEELDLSSTAIKTLDLGAMDVARLKKLFMLGCEQLRSLLWDGRNPSLEVLHVDTRGKTRPMIHCGEQRPSVFEAHMAFTNGRFIWSVIKGLDRYDPKVHLHISTMIQSQVNITKSIEDIGTTLEGLVPVGPFLPYVDIVINKDTVTPSSLVWDHRRLYPLSVHIEIGEGSHHLESMNVNANFRNFIEYRVKSLHVHDNISITANLPASRTSWLHLEWCHVERCPNLHTLFPSWAGNESFSRIRVFSASDLLMAYCIWGRDITLDFYSFRYLQHVYLHNCPRLVFVLPISYPMPNLETIQIVYCQNLQHVFPLATNEHAQEIASGVTLEKLKHIRLYHLHRLEQICGVRSLVAPVLETITLKDCWGLRRVPTVSRQGPKPVVDCEKDWWDRLEWDGPEADHEPSLFETRHSAYYKKTLPRVSVLSLSVFGF
ncbi:hypothetical protein CFC21_063969 [Triticum aestivum]|uniref:Disease resistance protein At4g27190-like leucine-rich repeats domain-containing protein n=2 Tax=Triticum aestivum TaxID=4565 RepID=A0A3B6KBR5_WHEAT|nr:hypothetical protein CFC21_063969 [Triticum aestivum]